MYAYLVRVCVGVQRGQQLSVLMWHSKGYVNVSGIMHATICTVMVQIPMKSHVVNIYFGPS